MKNESNKQRNSAPTGAQDSESNSNADRPLGGAACSASDSLVIQTMATSVINGNDRVDFVMTENGGINIYVVDTRGNGIAQNPIKSFYVKPEHWKTIRSTMVKNLEI